MHVEEAATAAFFIVLDFSQWRLTMTTMFLSSGWRHLDDIPLVTLQYGAQRAEISLYGAHVLSYFDGQTERLWCSSTAIWQNNAAIRGGIPICWPWFGACDPLLNPDQQKRPNHGLVRNRLWQLSNWHADESQSAIKLSIEVADVPWLAQAVRLTYTVQLSAAGLSVELTTDECFVQQAALHSYFAVSKLAESKVTGLPTEYHNKVNQLTVTDDSGSCSFNGEIDRIYVDTADQLTLHTPPSMTILQTGHDASVVWNPGQMKGTAAADIATQWAEFVCVESATLTLQPKRLALRQQIPRC